MRLSNFSAKLPDSARFACITNKFRATADSHMQVMAASLMTEQDVVLFGSYSGATRDLMETLRTAKANGAKVILITHKESDIHRILLPFFLCKKAAVSENRRGSSFCKNLYRCYGTHQRQVHTYLPKTAT